MTSEIEALAYIKGLARFSLRKREEIDAFVRQRLRQVWKEAVADCDFYKGKQPPFPLLTKQEVRDNIDTGMISNKHIGDPLLVMDKTSGSAGDFVPFAYLGGYQRYARMVFSFMINSDWRWTDRYCVLSTIHCSRERCATKDLPSWVNRVTIPTSDNIFMDEGTLERAAALLKDNPGTIVHADPIYLAAVVSYLEEKRISITLNGISSTYELLTPNLRRYLERSFHCKVFDTYGSSEFGPMAYACQAGAMHIFEDTVFVEIIDKGKYFAPDVGEIVVTALDNPAMPLIRYRTGDLGRLIIGPCACHRTAKMMEVYGRSSQCMSCKDVLYTERDIARMMDIPGIVLYQLVQDSDGLVFNILLEKQAVDNGCKKNIEEQIRHEFGKLGVEGVSVFFVDHIRPEKSGKFKTIFESVTRIPINHAIK